MRVYMAMGHCTNASDVSKNEFLRIGSELDTRTVVVRNDST
jgi:hypothetical protein